MGTVFKKQYTKPLPKGAEVLTQEGKTIARWKPAKGRTATAPVARGKDGSLRILKKAATYTAKFRNGQGIVVEKATGCRDEGAARSVLAELEKKAEQARAGILSTVEGAIAAHMQRPVEEHVEDWIASLEARRVHVDRIFAYRHRLKLVFEGCSVHRIGDLEAPRVERWLISRREAGLTASEWNEIRSALTAFANWMVRMERLAENHLNKLPRLDNKAERQIERRALTTDEIHRFLDAARNRGLIAALTVSRGPNAGKLVANIRDDIRSQIVARGRERELCYLIALTTGLRRGELASLTIADVTLNSTAPCLTVRPENEKARRGASVPLRADVASELSFALEQRLAERQASAREAGEPLPLKLLDDEPLVRLPVPLTFNKDLKYAGIAKKDPRGRVMDFHALRHTFGTQLSVAGVPLRTAQSAMRHSDPSLTANVYTDPQLLDVLGAIESLPGLIPHPDDAAQEEKIAPCGNGSPSTEGLAPMLAPAKRKSYSKCWPRP